MAVQQHHSKRVLQLLAFLIGCIIVMHSMPIIATPHDFTRPSAVDLLYNEVFPENKYESERQLYQQALAHLKQKELTKMRSKSIQLTHYPLYPYLKYYELKQYISSKHHHEFTDYFQRYPDTLTSQRLRNTWLSALAKKQDWRNYVKHYKPQSDSFYECHYYNGLLQLGNSRKAFEGAKKLWLVGKSQPDACDPLFEAWKASPHFHPHYLWERAALAINKGKASLAKYLSKAMPPEEQALVKLWLRVRKQPRLLQQESLFKDTPKHREIILYGIRRLAYSDLDRALPLWDLYTNKYHFSEEMLAATRSRIAHLLAFGFRAEAGLWLEQANNDLQDIDLHTKQIRIALRNLNWNAVLKWITLLPEKVRTKSRWRYWRARALQSLAAERGRALLQNNHFPVTLESNIPTHNNLSATHINFTANFNAGLPVERLIPQLQSTSFIQTSNIEAKKLFIELAKERSFYGFLSSQHIARPMSLNLDRIDVTLQDLKRLASHKGILRAQELLHVGATLDAKREWIHAIKQLTRAERATAAKLAAHWDWPFYAIYTASRSDNRDDIDLRFPRIFHNSVAKNALHNDIATEWIFSVIRQESAFRKDAKSPVGALGVMQLMPSTAKYVSKKIGVKYKGQRALLDPEQNIKLGSSYLKQLLDRFEGNMVIATAAYNAGPRRASQWLPKESPIKGDIWIETIPIKETREYVQNIITYQAIYQYQLGFNPKLTQSLLEIPPLIN